MKKPSKYAIIVFWVLMVFTISACEGNYSKNIMIDDGFSADEEDTITKAVEEWNRVSREYLGYDIILYDGRRVDGNGFDPMEDIKILTQKKGWKTKMIGPNTVIRHKKNSKFKVID